MYYLVYLFFIWSLSSCSSVTYKDNNNIRTLVIEECAERRADSLSFNSKKSHDLLIKECEQLLFLNEDYQKFSNKRWIKSRNYTYDKEQEYFDEEVWASITDKIRKKRGYQNPETEILAAKTLNVVS